MESRTTLEALEARVAELEDERAIKQWMSTYSYLADKRDWRAFTNLFTEDAQWYIPNFGVMEGRDAIYKHVKALDETLPFFVHLAANPLIDIHGDTASGQWYFFVPLDAVNKLFGSGAGWVICKVTGSLVKTPDGWRGKNWSEEYIVCADYHKGWYTEKLQSGHAPPSNRGLSCFEQQP